MENKKEFELTATINIEAVRAGMSNANRLEDVALSIPVVDPKNLTIDSKIYGFEIVPINDQIKELKNDDAKCVARKEILVENLSKTLKPGFITVNGNYDLPMEGGTVVKLSQCYVANKEDAIEIARIATEVELDRAEEVLASKQKEVDFLREQLENDRF